MITISELILEPEQMTLNHQLTTQEKLILKTLAQSQKLNRYDSLNRFDFELRLRSNIIDSAKLLNQSGVAFATFAQSYCNPTYWDLQHDGGFRLKSSVLPSTAIRDIFANGRKYGFECATAIVIVYYRAVLQIIDENQFNRLFANLLLWDWHFDEDLRIITEKTNDFILGDVLYFDNPDVNPATPQWQGENVVFLERDSYYGHGIGIKSAQEMIAALNARRKPGARQSAYLLDQATRPGFQYLSQFQSRMNNLGSYRSLSAQLPHLLTARIGSNTYIQA